MLHLPFAMLALNDMCMCGMRMALSCPQTCSPAF
ncbi:hypothetical protein SAMN05421543_11957 [Alicyclobacillus macrosporangiidus]|uniref:Uncharacterized protein n=1 Tax=Alicyclobacillus macrosporangiidus TaxID=392015 RepID=A0A1I7KVA3_9BACL|nr:hypothetical protein SAMN05421543_11957 [Alicyclobacillus macrosporangiidus]